MKYLRTSREWIAENGSENVVYMDESGFEARTYRPHAYAKRGVKVHCKITGNKKKGRTNLIMAQRKKEWIAPLTFTGSCNHKFVTEWFEKCLIPELGPNSLVIIDNAPFHNQQPSSKDEGLVIGLKAGGGDKSLSGSSSHT